MQPRLLSISICLMLAGPLCVPAVAQQAGVIVKFDPSQASIGPFPTDYLTTSDPNQKTGLSVHLPMPDCTAQPSACIEVSLLNQLDGFNLAPRIRVNFSDAIDPTTLKPGIVFVWLDNLTSDEVGQGPSGQISAINQVIYDPATNTAYAKPDDFLDQHRRYALIVTDAVLDNAGNSAGPDPNFTACIQSPPNDYCKRLQQTVSKMNTAALPGKIVGASMFTTMSATAWLEQARDLLPQTPLGFSSVGTPVKVSSLATITFKAQVGSNPTTFQNTSFTTPGNTLLAGVDRFVFGTYQSPNFLNSQQYAANIPTATALTLPSTNNTIAFHAYVPSSPMPSGGYPVIIFGHAYAEHSYLTPTVISSAFAKAGYVTVAINAVGHGWGPQSTIQFSQQPNVIAEVSSGGRSVDLNGDGEIDPGEGCFISWPHPVGAGDCVRQTVVDLMQLVNLVRSGTQIDPASDLKLDGNKVYYSGVSFGAIYGTVLHALQPYVRAAAPNVGGGSDMDNIRWSYTPGLRALAISLVTGRTPSLANGGPSNFNDNYVLRNQPPKVNNVPGAIDIQNMFEDLEWLQMPGDSLSYAPHLNLTPLPNVPAKPTLFQFGAGDTDVFNPQSTALIRAAGLFNSSTVFRADLAATQVSKPGDPHQFLTDSYTNNLSPLVSGAAQQEILGFFASDGKNIPDPNATVQQLSPTPLSVTLFETPASPLETLMPTRTPAIANVTSATGIRSSVQSTIQTGSWVAIYGSNLANNTADWTGLIDNGQLPISLGGVSVTIDGNPAYIYFVSPGQINLQAPAAAAGDVQVVVTNNGASSAPMKVRLQNYAPAFFQWGANKYVLTTRYPDNAYVANPSIGPGFVAAHTGDVLVLWATGFGPTSPLQAPGVLAGGAHNVSQPVTVTIGGIPATVIGAALSPGLAGVYQIAIQLPNTLPSGDVPLKATVGGFNTPDNVYLFVAQ